MGLGEMARVRKENEAEFEPRSPARAKKYGEVWTPPELVNEMLDELEKEGGKPFAPGKTWLEPAAGTGNMVIEILKRRMAHGCTPTEAIRDTYAVELLKDNWEEMKRRILDLIGDTPEHRKIVDNNIAHANFLDPGDRGQGRKYPRWLMENTLDDFLEEKG